MKTLRPGRKDPIRKMKKAHWFCLSFILFLLFSLAYGQNILSSLGEKQNYRSKRISSFDPTGGNRDAISIAPGQTAVLAEIKGPAAIHHIWFTISAEAFYGRKLVLRMYWDGEDTPSVEVPVGDFFAVGHGLNRNLVSVPIVRSSEGRALNSYWFMPFRWSARITVTNEGSRPVGSFYYYIDYREVDDLKPEVPYFHAQYRQEFPCEPGKNYLILDAVGRGHYVGCNLSVLQRSMGWWGEGDDMIYVDGEESPSLHGTGSEDYFSDAWGMREGNNLYYGCSLQEEDFQVGAKATVYRFHLPDPIPFSRSIRVTIEHGHANDRSDFYSSVAYWYQAEPHKPFPPFPPVDRRLPFALETSDNFTQPLWVKINNVEGNEITYQDNVSGTRITAPTLATILTSYYDQGGQRYQAVGTEGASTGYRAKLTLKASLHDIYDIQVYYLKGPGIGNWSILKEIPKTEEKAISEEEKKSDETQEKVQEKIKEEEKKEVEEKQEQVEPVTPPEPEYQTLARVNGYGPETSIETLTIKAQELVMGENVFWLEVAGKDVRSTASDLAIVGVNLIPARQNFALDWYLIGPFDAPDMNNLTTVYPPEQEIKLNRSYQGKGGLPVAWKQVKAPASGYVALSQLVQPNEQAIAYGLTYLYSPEDREVVLLLGSDDGVRLWVNDNLVHTNPSYRGAYPDQDRVKVRLQAGWNKVLIKVLQGAGGWGYYLRIPDPKGEYRWSARPTDK
ncbi:MAG: hypothetical protein OP8BY_1918 [Candidatus Saccharicenans subterraneus]|uniref:DUF2961 domain-containing protein n=1 Tax=Candidatus Saccharicenans subterraneus TaxID=2508984 RepID=A0A3E2BNM2_9BACT|nr:MAG: hypothetical protein OP8BY_1918 [Candidatus Saccharicenans subterraneum]